MRCVLFLVLLVLEPSFAQINLANSTAPQHGDTLSQNLDYLRALLAKSRLAVELPGATYSGEIPAIPHQHTQALLDRLPQPVLALMGSPQLSQVLKSAIESLTPERALEMAQNRDTSSAVNEAVQKLDAISPIVLASVGYLQKSGVSGLAALGDVFSQIRQPSKPQMHAGRPLAVTKIEQTNPLTYFLSLGIATMFALFMLLVPLFEYMVLGGVRAGQTLDIQNYSTNTIYSMFAFLIEYFMIGFAVTIAMFYKISSMAYSFEIHQRSSVFYFLAVLIIAVVPFTLIVSLATGVAKPSNRDNSNFGGHVGAVSVMLTPILIGFVIAWKIVRRTTSKQTLLQSSADRINDLASGYTSRSYQQLVSEPQIEQLGHLFAWYGNERADAHTLGSPGKTTFTNLVKSKNCHLVDYVMVTYQDELRGIACHGSKAPVCASLDSGIDSHGPPTPGLISNARYLFTISGPKIEASQQDLERETATVEEQILRRRFNSLSNLELPQCSTIVSNAQSGCSYEQDGTPCPCLLREMAAIETQSCRDYCSLSCTADEVFQRVYSDTTEAKARKESPRTFEQLHKDFTVFLIALATILMATGSFFGIKPECGPLMSRATGLINSTPNCAVDSRSCTGGSPAIPYAKEWVCSQSPFSNIREGTHCVLVCEQGYEPQHGLTTCESNGFFLTQWSHTANTQSGPSCVRPKDPCDSLLYSGVVRNSILQEETGKPDPAVNTGVLSSSSVAFTTADHKLMISVTPNHSGATISAYVKLNTAPVESATAADQALFSFKGSADQTLATLYITRGNLLTLDKTGTKHYRLDWAAAEWHHVMLTWEIIGSNTNAYLFVDGQPVKEIPTWTPGTLSSLVVGNGLTPELTPAPLNGAVSTIRVWSRPIYSYELTIAPYADLCLHVGEAANAAQANVQEASGFVDAQTNYLARYARLKKSKSSEN
eukprot:c32246_g1_i1.p1 GENE.c32246_g1_i1~~c32246_g1_i1.p1  ORF type:complete len:940 (-),score=130.39 c32246_g1_i1:1103-3922(-)